MVLAVDAGHNNDKNRVAFYMLLTIIGGAIFVGICGQGPSDHKDLAAWLLEEGIESMSLNPDTVVETWFNLSRGLKKIV